LRKRWKSFAKNDVIDDIFARIFAAAGEEGRG
jgi:hypothetical protein